jgi:serine phosphatase RsbU (regulator of sigma subunit)
MKVEKMGENYQVTFAGAKRPLYCIRQVNDTFELEEIAGDRCSVGMGVKKDMQLQNHTLLLQTGNMLYLSSDGFADQNNKNRKSMGTKILKETLQNIAMHDLPTQMRYLEAKLDEHQGEADQRDDITLLGVRL